MDAYISRETIEAVMQEVTHLAYENPAVLTDQMEEEQPVLFYYLFELDELPFGLEEEISFSEAEADYILYIGFVIWQALKTSQRPMRPVTWDDLRAVMADMEKLSFNLAGQDHSEIPGAALLMIENHPEPELLRFIVDTVRPQPGDQDFQPIRPQYRWVALMLFQIILNALLGSREA